MKSNDQQWPAESWKGLLEKLRIIDPDIVTRGALAHLIHVAQRSAQRAFVIVNNKAEGSAFFEKMTRVKRICGETRDIEHISNKPQHGAAANAAAARCKAGLTKDQETPNAQ